jgi:hypothetical protein
MQEFKIDKHNIIVADFKKARDGFNHEAILLRDGREIDRTKIHYINRTWESYEFESVLEKMLSKHPEIKRQEEIKKKTQQAEHEKVESQFQTVGNIAGLGDIFAKTPEERVAWKLRMIKAGLPDVSLPEDWNELSVEEKETRLDNIIKFLKEKNKTVPIKINPTGIGKGHHHESIRHSLQAKGIKTGRKRR